jgi:hypothetical protein
MFITELRLFAPVVLVVSSTEGQRDRKMVGGEAAILFGMFKTEGAKNG